MVNKDEKKHQNRKSKPTNIKNEISTIVADDSTKQSANTNKSSAVDFPSTGHRPVTSCSHCRQHKIKCNATFKYPDPCDRCLRVGLDCEIDPQFRPKKGSQLQNLRNDVNELMSKIDSLIKNDQLILSSLNTKSPGILLKDNGNAKYSATDNPDDNNSGNININETFNDDANHKQKTKDLKIAVQTYLVKEPPLMSTIDSPNSINNDNHSSITSPINGKGSTTSNNSRYTMEHEFNDGLHRKGNAKFDNIKHVTSTTNPVQPLSSPYESINEFVLGDVKLSLEKANYLHDIFTERYLPFFPIMISDSATKLCNQSQLLFWTVMLTASLSEPTPTLYMKLAGLIKQLAIETCWLRTPRSTHISQALLILCIWPLPNQKILDDCSYRFVGLAKSLSLQLGLHRGEFYTEFTRTQTLMANAEKWRTRTWLGIYFAEICWASIIGLPPNSQTDYLIEHARVGGDLDGVETNENNQSTNNDIFIFPKLFRRLICLAHFQNKLYNVLGSSIVSSDGLMEPKDRAGALTMMNRELQRLNEREGFEDLNAVNIYYQYVKLTICCFAFLPKTPTEDQTSYVTEAYLSATKIVTLFSKLLETRQVIELPIYVRQSVTYAAFILFKLYLTPYLLTKYVDSSRQSVVTVYRLYRNQLAEWSAKVENDLTRTTTVLDKLNLVLLTHPEVFTEKEGIITRMRSHLTGSLFYDLVYCVHEARRRETDPEYNEKAQKAFEAHKLEKGIVSLDRKLVPLPFYNQISKEDFQTITNTTPGGTTITKLVPTKNAIAKSNKSDDGSVNQINGIPFSMLSETGSVNIENILGREASTAIDNKPTLQRGFDNSSLFSGNLNSSSFLNQKIGELYNTTGVNGIELKSSRNTVLKNESAKEKMSNSSMQRANSIPADYNYSQSVQSSLSKQFSKEKDPSIYDWKEPLPNHMGSSTTISGQTKRQRSRSIFGNQSRASNRNQNDISPVPLIGTALNNVHNTNTSSTANTNNKLASTLDTQGINITNSGTNINMLSEIDNFLLQQSNGWMENSSLNDDFLGWFDMNMEPGF
ncbi:hypothetical protein TPHA_0E00880 [Tetrapisispora phaffii CBS 4417]|uniref:Zn(2)-C6 fungal-type domain-containing protein n=1 Tax=Tetrapisispora phaffii (strain ATCC 24235 / CBS 4417 / NBRC 1672 / NRRL Y-8282 / UCD 70-5) TaxID=1071381 RepID=G8BTF5_TETPH|nr:hypothetical protein TPHA_0E00880 [Tetrapisispora phaffii CBS 4417]CCE63183.1 hypothetical protein TPHA_0E00880 [Tetrapisispora phaffii CBS 4417]